MRFAPIGIIVMAVLVPATEPVRLEPPNLSGRWIYDPAHSDRTSRRWLAVPKPEGAVLPMDIDQPPEPSLGNQLTIRQDPSTVTLELGLTQQSGMARTVSGVRADDSRSASVVQYSVVYRLDGSESRNETPSTHEGRTANVTFSTATWNGSVLVVTIRAERAERPTGTCFFHLDYDGRLIVDTTNFVETPRTYTTAYTKKPA
jgi:hypothetical protein